MLIITSPADNGNIVVMNAENNDTIRLMIKPDSNNARFLQWFHYDLQGTPGQTYVMHIENAGKASYPGWNTYEAYQAYASYDNEIWFNLDTVYDETSGRLTMKLPLEQENIKIAFFPPYTYEMHKALIDRARHIPHCQISSLGQTHPEEDGQAGRDITLLTFGDDDANKKRIWLIARQHPGEPQAEWYAEGLIEYLGEHPELLNEYTFYVVPNMNPDGTYLGHLRTNKEGADLNRMWQDPTLDKSPEVYYVMERMKQTGVDLFVDIHSDEIIPKAFLDEAHLGCPESDPVLEKKERDFMELYMKCGSGMQNELNYGEKDRANPANLMMASKSIGYQFKCPAWTLEMPTKNYSKKQCKDLACDLFPVLQAFEATLESKQEARPMPSSRSPSLGRNSFLATPRQDVLAINTTEEAGYQI